MSALFKDSDFSQILRVSKTWTRFSRGRLLGEWFYPRTPVIRHDWVGVTLSANAPDARLRAGRPAAIAATVVAVDGGRQNDLRAPLGHLPLSPT